MKAIVCLPTRNEIESIDYMIDNIQALGLDLFISDSNSTDGTIEAAQKKHVEVFQRSGPGKGYGIREAIEKADEMGYDTILFLDCDQTYPVERLPDLLDPEFDLVIATRNMKDIPWGRRLANLFFTGLVNLLFGAKLRDVNSGMRALKVEKFLGRIKSKNWGSEPEMTCMALRKKWSIKEVPIAYSNRSGSSKISIISSSMDVLAAIIRERFFGK